MTIVEETIDAPGSLPEWGSRPVLDFWMTPFYVLTQMIMQAVRPYALLG